MSVSARLARAIATFPRADKAWTEAYCAICPPGVWPGDFRYTDAAKGEPGSELRALHDVFVVACDEHQAAWAAVSAATAQERAMADGAIRACPHLTGREAYDASLAAVPLYPDGSPRPDWDGLGAIARWSWEREPTA